MQISADGLLLSVVKYGESTAICRCFTAEYGILSLAIRGALSQKNRAIYQPGNLLTLHWKARQTGGLPSGKAELAAPYASHAMQDALRLSLLNSLLQLSHYALAEHDPHPALWQAALAVLAQFIAGNHAALTAYCRFERRLLEESGYRLSLDYCVATGVSDAAELRYVSPKSGGAVSAEAAGPYRDKLLPLPAFLLGEGAAKDSDIEQALTLTGYFLQHWLASAIGKELPAAREQLCRRVRAALGTKPAAHNQAAPDDNFADS